ncbi:MAG: DUF29 domain-containing protein [Candidatus Nitrosoglobus sp.]|jgi:hypothetical protein
MSIYETDFYRWTQETAEKLRQGRIAEVNVQELIEELEDMGKSERRTLESRLSVLLGHLLKWQYQPDGRSYSWQGTIGGQRKKLHRLLRGNLSLRPRVPEFGEEAYLEGIQLAVEETNMSPNTFPATFEQTGWSWEQVLDMEYLPD